VEWRYRSTHSLTSTLDGGEWSASRPGRFNLRERAPGIHWIGCHQNLNSLTGQSVIREAARCGFFGFDGRVYLSRPLIKQLTFSFLI